MMLLLLCFRYNETINTVEKTFSGLMSKIGALEGVISDLHDHHEQHEQQQEVKEKEHMLLHRKDISTSQVGKQEDGGDVDIKRVANENESDNGQDVSTVLLIMASPNRPQYLKKCLGYVAKYHPK